MAKHSRVNSSMKLFRILGGIIATLLFATGVGQIARCSREAPNLRRAPVAAGDHEIVLGFAWSISGWMADYSAPPALGAKLAISDINNSGGLLGKQIRIVEADVRSERTEGAKASLVVISQGVDMVVVDCDFDMGGPAALRAQNAGLIAFSLCAGDPKMGPVGIGPYAFTAGNAAHTEGSAIVEWGYHEKGYRKLYVLVDDVIEYNKSVCAGFRWAWNQMQDTEIVGEDVFQNDAPSIQPLIDRMKAVSEPFDAIAICSYAPGGGAAIRQIRAAGVDAPILTSGTFDGGYWIDTVPNIDEVYVPTLGSVFGNDPDPKVEQFMQRIYEETGARPATSYSLAGYALVQMWARAVENAGTVETKAVVAALEKLRDVPTVTGPRSYSRDLHIQNKARYLIIGWHQGELKIEGYWNTGPIPLEVLMKN